MAAQRQSRMPNGGSRRGVGVSQGSSANYIPREVNIPDAQKTGFIDENLLNEKLANADLDSMDGLISLQALGVEVFEIDSLRIRTKRMLKEDKEHHPYRPDDSSLAPDTGVNPIVKELRNMSPLGDTGEGIAIKVDEKNN